MTNPTQTQPTLEPSSPAKNEPAVRGCQFSKNDHETVARTTPDTQGNQQLKGKRPPRDASEVRALRARKHQDRIRLANSYADAFEQRCYNDVAYKLRSCHQKEILVCCRECKGNWYILDKCKLRICPICSRNVFIERARYIRACCAKSKFPKLITLTQPLITEDPRQGIKNLKTWFAQLRKNKIFANVRGGAYTIEVIPKPTGWHIHLHALVDSPYIPHQQLWSVWKEITGNDVPQTDIRAAKTPAAIEYIAKYASKSASMYLSGPSIVDYYLAVHGFRLFVTFGCFYNAKLEDLDETYKPFIPESLCPHCKQPHTSFRARDGPMLFGREFWEAAQTVFTTNLPFSRPYTSDTPPQS